jgi:hypothetical protein
LINTQIHPISTVPQDRSTVRLSTLGMIMSTLAWEPAGLGLSQRGIRALRAGQFRLPNTQEEG